MLHVVTAGTSRRGGGRERDSIFVILSQWAVIPLQSVRLKEFSGCRKENMITSSHSFAAAEAPSVARHVVHVPLHQRWCRVLQYTPLFSLKALSPIWTISFFSSHRSEMSLFCRSGSSSSTVSFGSKGESLTWHKSYPQTASSQATESNTVSSSSSEYFSPAGHPAATSTISGEAETVPAADPRE